MCGRITRTPRLYAEYLEGLGIGRQLTLWGDYVESLRLSAADPSQFNVAPTQRVDVVRGQGAARDYTPMHWGLVPFWAKDRSMAAKMINARAETVAEKPAFRAAYRHRRCVVGATGWYEWQLVGRRKEPWLIQRPDQEAIAMAGLWEEWTDVASGEILESCTIITTQSGGEMARLHHRMPVLLDRAEIEHWLTPDADPKALTDLLVAWSGALSFTKVSTYVNNSRNLGPECVRPTGDLFG